MTVYMGENQRDEIQICWQTEEMPNEQKLLSRVDSLTIILVAQEIVDWDSSLNAHLSLPIKKVSDPPVEAELLGWKEYCNHGPRKRASKGQPDQPNDRAVPWERGKPVFRFPAANTVLCICIKQSLDKCINTDE